MQEIEADQCNGPLTAFNTEHVRRLKGGSARLREADLTYFQVTTLPSRELQQVAPGGHLYAKLRFKIMLEKLLGTIRGIVVSSSIMQFELCVSFYR